MRNTCYRCSTCASCWPRDILFKKCPECGSDCWVKVPKDHDEVATREEALSIKAHTEFRKYCEKRDAKIAAEELAALESEGTLYPSDVVR